MNSSLGPFAIERHALLSFHRLARGTVLRCLRGRLWITARGDGVDHVLHEGGQLAADGLRHIVVYGLDDLSIVAVHEASFAAGTAAPLFPPAPLRRAAATGPHRSARR